MANDGEVFRLHLLPAQRGDAIVVEYGTREASNFVVVDAGPKEAYDDVKRSLHRVVSGADIRLLVVTHVDTDHIDGAIKLLGEDGLGWRFEEIWFNGWPQLQRLDEPVDPPSAGDSRGAIQGEYLQVRINKWPRNTMFSGGPVVVRDDGDLPQRKLPGGLVLTLLSPTTPKLKKLETTWRKTLAKIHATPGDGDFFTDRLDDDSGYRGTGATEDEIEGVEAFATKADSSVANGSSIAFLAEFADRRCALLADAHMDAVEDAVQRWCEERERDRLPLSAVKLSHHGSSSNLTDRFLDLVDCRDFLVSSDGSRFRHPHKATLERIIRRVHGSRIHFNYRSDTTSGWSSEPDQARRGYRATYPANATDGIVLDLMSLPPCP